MYEERFEHLYNYPRYYDLVYGSDWKAEFDFLSACFAKYSTIPVQTLFEPACGTGRLMIKFAQAGFQIAGNDLNEHAVQFCNQRLKRHGFAESAVVGDMSNFELQEPVDAAFNMINSFRHLLTEEQAVGHFNCMASALKPEGLYFLGLHLTPTVGERIEEEEWSSSRGHLTVISSLWSEGINMETRLEQIGMKFSVYTPTETIIIRDQMQHRIYTVQDMSELLEKISVFQIVETFDFGYNWNEPLTIDAETEDIVYVLRHVG